ncbi:hypothetical protein DC897_RS22475 [Vibrio parahaemolyticus]|uniref:hypothetical protein n=1 Tax=Vibrio parahaemolyticus TaxID=670 RepID=UPI0008136019|nr:hypothetical protein [Vibrio parahaemolyticus]EGQ8312390.1 hypothetical protein [Vibrio parahaemolyticus]EGQ8853007.1 hypothetical protein [Vibrio parahaemolyticus]EGQ8857662.1 hypothetical protein [Vibrio parahaemolyticus]EGQ8876999.1 hypothetical protein [Vibrio parahaemolyticus]EGQ8996198.1 hypothetical protein [Vibrio parahaemolyticus]
MIDEKLNMLRARHYAGAGLCVASLIAYTTLSSLPPLLMVSTFCFAIALPAHMAVAFMAEHFLLSTQEIRQGFDEFISRPIAIASVVLSYLGTAIAVLLVVFSLNLWAGIFCLVSALIAYKVTAGADAKCK